MPMIMSVWALAAVLSGLGLRWLLARALDAWLDAPNHRSLHARPVPRVGGFALHSAWLAAMLAALAWIAVSAAPSSPGIGAWGVPSFGPWLSAAGGLALAFAVSATDDRRSLRASARFAVQSAAALMLAGSFGGDVLLRWPPALGGPVTDGPLLAVGVAVLLLAILWAMNLFNFMDGADGLAGGMALFGFATYAVVAWPVSPFLAVGAAAVSGAAAGFLMFNFPPARVFMGDAGSVPLGYLAAAFGLAGIAEGAWGWWLPPLAFLPFILDATVTLLRRAARRERVWEAHRQHAYQRLILLGWTHRRSALAWWGAMAMCSIACILLSDQKAPVQWVGVVAATVLHLAAFQAVDAAWRRHDRSHRTDQAPAGREP